MHPSEFQPGYDLHIFVCTNQRDGENARISCAKNGGREIHAALKAVVSARPDNARGDAGHPKIRVNQAGCLDYCEHGPMLVAYRPDAAANWHANATVESAVKWLEERREDL